MRSSSINFIIRFVAVLEPLHRVAGEGVGKVMGHFEGRYPQKRPTFPRNILMIMQHGAPGGHRLLLGLSFFNFDLYVFVSSNNS